MRAPASRACARCGRASRRRRRSPPRHPGRARRARPRRSPPPRRGRDDRTDDGPRPPAPVGIEPRADPSQAPSQPAIRARFGGGRSGARAGTPGSAPRSRCRAGSPGSRRRACSARSRAARTARCSRAGRAPLAVKYITVQGRRQSDHGLSECLPVQAHAGLGGRAGGRERQPERGGERVASSMQRCSSPLSCSKSAWSGRAWPIASFSKKTRRCRWTA